MKKIVFVMLLVFAADVMCQAQNNRYQLKVDNVRYDPTESLRIERENLENAEAGHRQDENQIWSDLERVNNCIKQGDYDNANLLIDRCIQLNAQWQYHLVDHSMLTKKKNEITEAKRMASNRSYNSSSSFSQNEDALYNEDYEYAVRFNTFVSLASEIVNNANDPNVGYDKKTAFYNARRMLVDAHGLYRSSRNTPLLKSDIYMYETIDELLTKAGYPPYEPKNVRSQLDLKFTQEMVKLQVCYDIMNFATYPMWDIMGGSNVDKKTSYRISRMLLNKYDELYKSIRMSSLEEYALRKYYDEDAEFMSDSYKRQIDSMRKGYDVVDRDLKKEGY